MGKDGRPNDGKVEEILLKDEKCWKGEILAEIHGNRKRQKSCQKNGNLSKKRETLERRK